jgi:ribosomal protein S18 acetylase RimI-like enzyme
MIEVRKAAAEDEQDMIRLIMELGSTVGYEAGFPEIDYQSWLKTFRDMQASPQWTFLVAQEGEKMVGLLVFYLRPTLTTGKNRAKIGALVVTEEVRGKGVGRLLIEEALEQARAMNCSSLDTSTEIDNHKAIAFYEKLGFKQEHIYLELKI